MRRLTQLFLVSSCLVSTLPMAAFGVVQNVAANANIDADGIAEGVNFTATATLTVPTNKNIGNTAGVSVSNAAGVNVPQIDFQGNSTVTGSITAAGFTVRTIELQGGLGTTVKLNGATTLTSGTGQINYTTNAGSALEVNGHLTLGAGGLIDFTTKGTNSTVTFANGINFSGSVNTDTVSTGTVIFAGNSTVSDGLLGDNNSILDVKLGSGTVYLNTVGVNQADTFKFTKSTGSNTLKLTHLAKITGNIDNQSGTANSGTLLFEQDSTIIGNVGTTSPLSLITMSDVASTVTFAGNVKANTIQLSNSKLANQNTLIFDPNPNPVSIDITADIQTATNDVGIVNLTNVANFTGNIGQSTLMLNEINFDGVTDLTLTGNIYVGNGLKFLNDKTITVANGNFINGSVIGKAGTGGNLVFAGSSQSYGLLGTVGNSLTSVTFDNAGTFNLYHDINATDVNVKNNATLIFNQNTALSNNLNLDATGANLTLGNAIVAIGGKLNTTDGNLISLDLKSDTVFGKLVVVNQAIIDAPVFKISTSGYIPNNTDLKIVTAGGGIAELNAATLENTSTLLSNFTLTKNANDITLNVTRNTNTSIADYPFTLGVAGALDVIQDTPALIADPDIFAVVNELDNFVDRANYNKALATLAPSVDGDNFEGIMALTRLGVETIRERLDSYRLGQLEYLHTGYSAGSYNPLKGYGMWVKLLASRLKQSEYGGIEGYKSDIWGISGGLDYTSPDEQIVYGIGLNYANTDSLSRTSAASSNMIDSYSLSLYGTYNFPNPWYLDGILYLTQHNYDQTRNISVGAVSGSAKTEYEAWQISARLETGFVYQYNKVLFQPILGLFYSHINRDDYTESGAGGTSLVNRPKDLNSLRLAFGPKISSVLGAEGASLIPEFHAYYNFELVNNKEQFVSNFVVGGPTFETYGIEPKRSSYIAGVGLAAYGFENISCHVNVDYEFNDTKFSAFHGSLKFKYTW